MALDNATFRQTMGSFTSGVTVVTTVHENVRYGMTVSSFASLSLQPQLLLVCITHTLPTYLAIVESKQFGVSILAADQASVSQQFASRQPDKFAGVAWHSGSLGLPLISGACATVECRLVAIHPGGDHAIVVGEIVTAQITDAPPLVYVRGAYRQLA